MRKYKICTGNSRHSAIWTAAEVSIEELLDKLMTPIRTAETVDEYRKMKKAERDDAKDKGGFIGGTLKGAKRKKANVLSRSIATLDGDNITPEFFEKYEKLHRYKSILYTTHSHTAEAPRVRLLVFFSRDITPEECNAISRYLAAEWGIDMFDTCSYEVNQLMYWPTCPSDGEYICRLYDGELLDPDVFLAAHPGWRDPTTLPRAASETKAVEHQKKKLADPLAKEGVVGAFCRAYDIQNAIAEFLSGVYAPSAVEGRYDYVPGEGSAGVVIYDDKFAYSHHATDPAGGKLLNAFDLVRIHKFGDMDDKKSFQETVNFALQQDKVKLLLLEEKQASAETDFGGEDWKKKLRYTSKGAVLENCLHNAKLIIQNDPNLKNIVFNQLADGLEIKGDVPWQHPAKFWRDADDAQLICYVDDHYGSFSQRNYDIAVTKVADDRSYHPIRQYLEALPPWDGVRRVDTLFIDYLGADDNEYIRAVCRKTLCAAYKRVYHPGIKFDYLPVFNGAQGIGKSTLISKLGMEWFSDSLTLSDMNDKTAAEKLQGYWIHEIGELAGMKKADLDKVKAFVSRCDDKYRASFGKRVTPHPRQCVFFGTTNSENGYLRDITGNRRFWNVKVSGSSKYKPWKMTSEVVQQIWAETILLANAGEELFLPPELERYAQEEQREAMEQDDREGFVREYLDMLLPVSWDDMDMYKRREYFRYPDDPTRPEGVAKRSEVSNLEIWCECFGKAKEDIKPADSYAIAAIMKRLKNWEKTENRKRIPIYGLQRIYARKTM